MQGGTRKRGKTWSYYFDLAKVDGKRKKTEKGGFRTKKEAEAALAKAMAQYNSTGAIQDPSNISFADLAEEWFALYCEPNLSANTLLNYRNKLNLHIKPRFGNQRARTITSAEVQNWVNEIKINGNAHSQVCGMLAVLSQIFDYAIEPLHYLEKNPCKYVKIGKAIKPPKERIILTDEQFSKIIDRFVGTRFYLPLMIGWHCGLRIGECMGLSWDDIDFETRIIHVQRQMNARKIHDTICWVLQPPKNNSMRKIAIGETLYNILKEARQEQRKNEIMYGEYYTIQVLKNFIDHQNKTIQQVMETQKSIESKLPRFYPVCIDNNGMMTTINTMRYCNRVIHYELNMAFDYHSLRHTHATKLVEAGANIKAVQERLGHKNISITMNTYVHYTDTMGADAIKLLEQTFATE